MARTRESEQAKREQDRDLTEELEMTFPASDPPTATEPGGGVTGPEKAPPDAAQERDPRGGRPGP